MEQDAVVRLLRPGASLTNDPLLEVLRSGACRMLQQVIEAELPSPDLLAALRIWLCSSENGFPHQGRPATVRRIRLQRRPTCPAWQLPKSNCVSNDGVAVSKVDANADADIACTILRQASLKLRASSQHSREMVLMYFSRQRLRKIIEQAMKDKAQKLRLHLVAHNRLETEIQHRTSMFEDAARFLWNKGITELDIDQPPLEVVAHAIRIRQKSMEQALAVALSSDTQK